MLPQRPLRLDREKSMRLFLGIILGSALTIGGAYLYDSSAGSGQKPMVNWETVNANAKTAMAAAREQWDKLTK
jgi:hypothetical protein